MNHSEAGRLGAIKTNKILAIKKKGLIEIYNTTQNKCKECSASIPYDKRLNKFCNRKCSAIYINKKIFEKTKHNFCLLCNKELPFKREWQNRKFCSHECRMQYKRNTTFERITKLGYIPKNIDLSRTGKLYLISVRGHKCEKCGLSEWLGKPISISTHHKNGKSKDNRLTNLELLCPNCHTQTPNFGSKNKNCDRTWRKKYYRYADETH